MHFEEEIKSKANKYIDNLEIAKLEDKVKWVIKEREELKGWTDRELRLSTLAFRDDLKKGASLDSLLVPAFALINEAARRVMNQVPYPVQILAGLVIHQGKVVEMKAGEGKTLTETMPVYLNALEALGVHLVTTNDYLAERDAKINGKLFDFLGLTVGHVTSEMKSDQHRKAYACDITYVSNQEIGFDYLRDNLVYSRADRVLRAGHPLHFGIVDEIDSILIDESRTPLIIAEPVKDKKDFYFQFNKIVEQLEEDRHYTVDYVHKNITMTNAGLDKVEQILNSPIFSKDNPMYAFYLDVCLKAKVLFERDRDYIVTAGGIEIVDEFTGRVLPGRRFTDGVHQAIEAKEKVKIKESDKTQAAITFQNFFPMYEKLSGMSGTVMGAREEFNQVYKLDVVQVPTNRPLARKDLGNLYFKTQKGKFLGMAKKINQIHKRGQPLLIGARNVETAHDVAGILENLHLPFQLLTASDNRAEAEKIAKAGQEGMITIATNMAGRGTDIMLGAGVAELGGLFVLGTERHESRRIDDQLVGRAGRQGDPGTSQFLISMEDEIMQLFGSERIIDVMEQYDIPEDEYISGKSLDEAFDSAQKMVESKNYDTRIYLYKYDSVTSFQRETLYELRDSLLENEEGFEKFIKKSLSEVVDYILSLSDPLMVAKEFEKTFSVTIKPEELEQIKNLKNAGKEKTLRETLGELLNPFYKKTGQAYSLDEARGKISGFLASQLAKIKKDAEVYQAAQNLILEIIDKHWGDHLELVDVLKEEAGLLSYASEDPLIDYILESKKLFENMLLDIKTEFFKMVFKNLERKGLLE